MNVIKLVILSLGILAFSQANAQMKKGNPEKRFAKIDADGSGSFDLNEFTAFKEAMAAKRAEKQAEQGTNPVEGKERKQKDPAKAFGKMDSNSNGNVDLAEYTAFVANQKEKKAKRKARQPKR